MKEDQFHAKGTCRSFSKILARSQSGASLEVHSQNSTQVGTRCSRPCYDWKLMTLGANYLRLLYFFGLCAWFSMPSASAPAPAPEIQKAPAPSRLCISPIWRRK